MPSAWFYLRQMIADCVSRVPKMNVKDQKPARMSNCTYFCERERLRNGINIQPDESTNDAGKQRRLNSVGLLVSLRLLGAVVCRLTGVNH